MPRVFISYRQVGAAQCERVKDLALKLRRCGIEVVLDQLYLEAHPGGPPEGWDKWSSDQALNTENVIIIGTEAWFQCFEKKQPPGTGLGAACEADDLRHRIYEAGGVIEDIRVVIFEDADEAYISPKLKRYHRFHAESDFTGIVRWLGGTVPAAREEPLPSTTDSGAQAGSAAGRPETEGTSPAQEMRIRDFVEIVGSVLLEFKDPFKGTAPELLVFLEDEIRTGSTPCTRNALEAIGHKLWTLVGARITGSAGWVTVYEFWKKLLAELRQRFPRVIEPDEWKEFYGEPKHYQAKRPHWIRFLESLVDASILDSLDPEATAALLPYRDHLVGKFREINLSGFGGPGAQSEAEGKAELSRIYIDLDTKTGLNTKASLDAKTDGDAKTKPAPGAHAASGTLSALQQMAVHPRLVLIGLPGSGKSTLLEFFSLCLAQCSLNPGPEWLERLSTWPKEETDLVPVFVELRLFAASLAQRLPPVDGGEQLKQYILEQLQKSIPLPECAEALKRALVQGRAIVFLDGLDEVPNNDELRRFVLETVEEFSRGSFKKSRIVVTCRPRSYEETAWQLKGFEKAELAALTLDKIALFIEKFYAEVARRDPDVADVTEDRKTKLGLALLRRELSELATNPFMLTVMAWLHRFEDLPEKRAVILDKIVEQLLYKWEERKRRNSPLVGNFVQIETLSNLLKPYGVAISSVRRVLCRLAYKARNAGKPEFEGQPLVFDISISERDLLEALEQLLPPDSMMGDTRQQWAVKVRHFIDRRTGLLVPDGISSFTMPYKLQEFLAGEHLTNNDELEAVGASLKMAGPRYNFDEVVSQLIGENSYWEEVVKWAGAIQTHVKDNKSQARDLAYALCTFETKSCPDSTRLRRAIIAQEILLEIGLVEVINSNSKHGPECLETVRKTLDELMWRKSLRPQQRASAAVARGWLEALPEGVGLDDSKKLPDIIWIEVPAGKFRMGDKESGTDRNPPPLTEIKASYCLSRFPVTVAQFQAFVNDGGYENEDWWNWPPDARQWLKTLKQSPAGKKPGPENYDPVFQTPNHPRVGVSWYEAVAFCKWLNNKLGLPENSIQLPTEEQWVRAARGPEGPEDRDFPSGSTSTKSLGQQCNVDQSKIGHTSAVNLFPAGDTPLESPNKLGVADLAGNVWEWCLTPWRENTAEGSDPLSDEKFIPERHRAARGGSWNFGHHTRLIDPLIRGLLPAARANDLGFRLVCNGIDNEAVREIIKKKRPASGA